MALRAHGNRRRALRLAIVLGLVAAVVGVVASSAFSNPSTSSKKWVIGVSNTLVGNGWREEMICSAKAEANASGKVAKVIVADRNGSAAEQAADIRNLISAGANAILLDPADPTSLNGVISQAAARGIKVVSMDSTVTAPQAYNVANDQTKYGYLGALWLFKQMGGKGNVVEMRGIAGATADTDRHKGFQQALKKYPGIKVVKSTFTGWQYATGGKQMLDILNSGVKVDGVWTSGIDYTVVNAFKTAGKPLVPIVGADNNQFLKQMLTQYPTLKGAAVTNPATIGGAAMNTALKLLAGQKVPKTQLLTPQVWSMPGSKAIMTKFYSAKLPPTYSDTLQIPGHTTYSIAQLNQACK
ncbi:MAG TPA: ABC transporter substrate-binding protein [Gaiellaceae bacterium]|jgi:ribose transport system substrate-binding protein|nr:ABC transporter substrate-binding protein [Gaiellaceae bacterium]